MAASRPCCCSRSTSWPCGTSAAPRRRPPPRTWPATPDPLILTLRLDPEAQGRFEALRRAHFPPARNLVPAHATLFHALPGEALDEVRAALAADAGTAPFPVIVAALRMLGRGVAFTLQSGELARRRAALAARFAGRLTRQDAAPWHPHVTVQNKVEPETARALHAALAADFAPWTAEAAAFELWHYRGGPWEPAFTQQFGGLPGVTGAS